MSHGSTTQTHGSPQIKKFEAGTRLNTAIYVMLFVGVLTAIWGAINNPERMWTSYLTAFFYVSTLSIGGFFFVTVNHISKAGWSSSIRRLAEGMASFAPYMLLGSVVLIFGIKKLYPWANEEVVKENAMIAKTSYLNVGLWLFGCCCFVVEPGSSQKIIGHSLKQDIDGLKSTPIKV